MCPGLGFYLHTLSGVCVRSQFSIISYRKRQRYGMLGVMGRYLGQVFFVTITLVEHMILIGSGVLKKLRLTHLLAAQLPGARLANCAS